MGDLRDIITAPARSQNWNIDPVLVDRLVRDLIDHHTQTALLTDLPLLALTLHRIWDTALTRSRLTVGGGGVGLAMVDNTLTPGDYDRVGGLRSVFATWCDCWPSFRVPMTASFRMPMWVVWKGPAVVFGGAFGRRRDALVGSVTPGVGRGFSRW